jgi:8-oxo-dGTP pyrophosphatase MutT (NUDIX family)
MKYLNEYERFQTKKTIKYHNLSGIALIVEDKILLVHPRKHKDVETKWSLPKGHIEGKDSLDSALKELKEETGIEIFNKDYEQIINFEYTKSNTLKLLDVYVYRLTTNDILKYLKSDWQIEKKWYNTKEIWKCKFFDIESAKNKIEIEMIELIDEIEEII